jgi:hypothetical protein
MRLLAAESVEHSAVHSAQHSIRALTATFMCAQVAAIEVTIKKEHKAELGRVAQEHQEELAGMRLQQQKELKGLKGEHLETLASISAALAACQAKLDAVDAHNRELRDAVRDSAAADMTGFVLLFGFCSLMAHGLHLCICCCGCTNDSTQQHADRCA